MNAALWGIPENRGAEPKYAHPSLDVGEFFEFDGDKAAAERVRQAARKWGQTNNGERFTVRRVAPGRYGCWRVE